MPVRVATFNLLHGVPLRDRIAAGTVPDAVPDSGPGSPGGTPVPDSAHESEIMINVKKSIYEILLNISFPSCSF